MLSETDEEYADSLIEIAKAKMIHIPADRRKSSGSAVQVLELARKNSCGSSILAKRGLSLSSADSLLSKSSKGDMEALKLHKEVIEMAKYQLWPLGE